MTPCRKARSASLFVGSIPSTRTKVHRCVSPASNSRHVHAVLEQEPFAPRSRSSFRNGRIVATYVWKLDRANVPSRTRCHHSNRASECSSNR